MKSDHVKALTKAYSAMLAGKNAAMATLGEIKNEFPEHSVVVTQATAVCAKTVKSFRVTFEKAVENIFNEATKLNTLSI